MSLESKEGINVQQYAVEVATDESQGPAVIKGHRTISPMFHSSVTRLDRWLVRKMVNVVGNPPVRISLWDGVEVTDVCEAFFCQPVDENALVYKKCGDR